jgi:hypothetical protein
VALAIVPPLNEMATLTLEENDPLCLDRRDFMGATGYDKEASKTNRPNSSVSD